MLRSDSPRAAARRRCLLAVAASLILTACVAWAQGGADPKAAVAGAPATTKAKVRKPDSGMPSEITIASSVGEVVFRHEAHIQERSIECARCHHQINARKLQTPHPDYLKSSWINCTVCHETSGKSARQVYACSECHRTNPTNIADETLSAKVVVHRQCWQCHPVSPGKEAMQSCEACHAGKKTL